VYGILLFIYVLCVAELGDYNAVGFSRNFAGSLVHFPCFINSKSDCDRLNTRLMWTEPSVVMDGVKALPSFDSKYYINISKVQNTDEISTLLGVLWALLWRDVLFVSEYIVKRNIERNDI
jgi:hypothetical protein